MYNALPTNPNGTNSSVDTGMAPDVTMFMPLNRHTTADTAYTAAIPPAPNPNGTNPNGTDPNTNPNPNGISMSRDRSVQSTYTQPHTQPHATPAASPASPATETDSLLGNSNRYRQTDTGIGVGIGTATGTIGDADSYGYGYGAI